MLHVWRLINGLPNCSPKIVTQKLKGQWPGIPPAVVPRNRLSREFGRFSTRLTGRPWQVGRTESDRLAAAFSGCDIVHIFFGNVAIHCLPLMERLNVPKVVSFHGSDTTGLFASDGSEAARRRLFSMATIIGCRSRELAGRIIRLGAPEGRVRMMRTGISVPHLESPKVSPEGAWVFFQAGRFVPKKGHFTTLEAFRVFRNEVRPDARLVLAGSGPLGDELRRAASGIGNVEFPGFLGQEEIASQLEGTACFLHPSISVDGDTEGVPNALLEAMAAGVPCIATRHGGIPEAIEDGASGLLVDEGDAEALFGAMKRLHADRDLYRLLSQGGHERVAECFSIAASVSAAEEIYHEAVETWQKARQ